MPQMATVTAWHLPVRRFVRTSVVTTEVGRMCQMDRVHLVHGGFVFRSRLPMESWYLDLYLDVYRLCVSK